MGNKSSSDPKSPKKKGEEEPIEPDPKTSRFYKSIVYDHPDLRREIMETTELKPEDALLWKQRYGIAEDGKITKPVIVPAVTEAQKISAWGLSNQPQQVRHFIFETLTAVGFFLSLQRKQESDPK